MKKKMNLWEKIRYYRIIQLLIFGALLFYYYDDCLSVVDEIFQITPRHPFYAISPYLVGGGMIWLWLHIVFSTLRNRYYLYLTGRNYAHDKVEFKPLPFGRLASYFKDADPHKLDVSGFPKIPWYHAKGLVLGSSMGHLIVLPSNLESNIIVFGPPGSGKTSGVGIINAICFDGSVICIDIKFDLYNYCHIYRNIVRFCPDDPNALTESAHFNPFENLDAMSVTDRKLYIENMATVLIPDEGGSDGAFFTSRARKFFQGIAHFMLYENPETTFPKVIHAILTGNPIDWVKTVTASDCTEAKELLSSFYGSNEKNLSGAYDNLASAIVAFSNPILDELLTDNENCISIDTLEKGSDVYLQISQEHLAAYAPLFTLIMQSISTQCTKRTDSSTGVKNRPILMLMDEFPALSFSYQMINSNLSTLRSKSVICMIICQNLAQLEHKYGETGARSIIGNCNYQLILGSNDPKSSKAYSETFGTKKVLKVSKSESLSGQQHGAGRNITETSEPIYLPEDFGDLGSDMVIYAKGKHCRSKKLNCYQNKPKRRV